MFIQALEAISRKIAKSKQKDQGYKMLENKIMGSPVLKAQFEIYTDLKENANKISSRTVYNSFYTTLTEKVNKVDATKTEQEVSALLEFFNIDPKSIKSTVMDKAMSLNEQAVKAVVVDRKKKALQEEYKGIIKTQDNSKLMKEFEIVSSLTEAVTDDRKKFIEASLVALKEERYVDYSACVKKLYKLRELTESILKEAAGEKTFKLNAGQYFKYAEATIVNVKEPQKLVLYLEVPIYPHGQRTQQIMSALGQTEAAFNRMETPFVNNFIIKGNRKQFFSPVGVIWKVKVDKQGKKIPQLGYQPGKFYIMISTNHEYDGQFTVEQFVEQAQGIVNEFDAMLPKFLDDLQDVLSPENKGREGKSDRSVIKSIYKQQPKGTAAPVKKKSKVKKGYFDIDDFGADYRY